MGKSGSRKRDRRIAETAVEYDNAVHAKIDAEVLANRDSDSLFIVDRTGSKNARRKIEKEAASAAKAYSVSKVEDHLIKKKIKAMEQGKSSQFQAKKQNAIQSKKLDLHDPWGDDSNVVIGRKPATNIVEEIAHHRNRAVMPPKAPTNKRKIDGPGFSYNPDEDQHQDLLAEALALELQALEKKARAEGTFGKNADASSTLNKEEIHDGSEDEEEESEIEVSEEEEESADKGRKLSRKQRQALERKTRAQRNKEKMKRKRLHELEKIQTMQRLIKTLRSVPRLMNELDKAAKIAEAQKAIAEMRSEEQAEAKAKALTYKEAGSVPLTDEIGDSLRTIRPKGNRLSGLQNSLIESKDAISKDHRRHKKGEHPHRAKNIKWHAKYKYNTTA